MLQTLLFAVLLQTPPAVPGRLELTNIQATHGVLGPRRADMNLVPGDVLHVAFDVGGLKPDAGGRLRFTTLLEVEDSRGKQLAKNDLGEANPFVNLLGGDKIRHAVRISTGQEQKPDQYRVKVTVKDVNAKQEGGFTRTMSVSPADSVALVRFQLSHDRLGQLPASAVAAVGQTLFLNFVAVGFDRDKEKFGAIAMEMALTDEQGKSTLAKPIKGEFRDIPPDTTFLPIRYDLPLHRAGNFKLTLKATDLVNKKSFTLTAPVVVVEQR